LVLEVWSGHAEVARITTETRKSFRIVASSLLAGY
jgi:hypothetical protein